LDTVSTGLRCVCVCVCVCALHVLCCCAGFGSFGTAEAQARDRADEQAAIEKKRREEEKAAAHVREMEEWRAIEAKELELKSGEQEGQSAAQEDNSHRASLMMLSAQHGDVRDALFFPDSMAMNACMLISTCACMHGACVCLVESWRPQDRSSRASKPNWQPEPRTDGHGGTRSLCTHPRQPPAPLAGRHRISPWPRLRRTRAVRLSHAFRVTSYRQRFRGLYLASF
jgi:hypothetical protein